MPYLQPTVRQLQPLGRQHRPALDVPEEVDAEARAADTVSLNAKTSTRRRRRGRYRLSARAPLSS